MPGWWHGAQRAQCQVLPALERADLGQDGGDALRRFEVFHCPPHPRVGLPRVIPASPANVDVGDLLDEREGQSFPEGRVAGGCSEAAAGKRHRAKVLDVKVRQDALRLSRPQKAKRERLVGGSLERNARLEKTRNLLKRGGERGRGERRARVGRQAGGRQNKRISFLVLQS